MRPATRESQVVITVNQAKERILIMILAVILIFAALSGAITAPVGAASVAVDTTSDISDGDTSSVSNLIADPGGDGVISLREAIEATNNTPGADTIGFNIPGCGSVCTIQPATPLPVLSDGGTTIDGYTQPGASPAGDSQPAILLIELDGSLITEFGGHGLQITSPNNQVRGLVIKRFGVGADSRLSGIEIYGSDAYGNIIAGNHIGTNPLGTIAEMNDGSGILIEEGAHENTVGGDSPADRNIISGNDQVGVIIRSGGADANVVSGNYIGTDAGGTQDLGNRLDGVHVAGDANNNRVGGNTVGERNLISGNDQIGVWVYGYASYIPSGNQILGNYIGTDLSGSLRLGNMDEGVSIWGGQDTTIQNNVISANGDTGIYMIAHDNDLTGNVVFGNYIGSDATGTIDLGNVDDGIYISSSSPLVAQDNTIGGLQPGEGNLISGNGRNGIFLKGTGTSANPVAGNSIGSDPGGSLDLGNRYNGILVSEGVQDSTLGPGNTIAFNRIGVKLSWESTTGIKITQNSIYGNSESGIELGSANNDIQAPVISAVSDSAPYQVEGNACTGCSVEVFASPTNAGQGKLYLDTASADGSGQFSISLADLPAPYLTATVTGITDGTSEFSIAFKVEITRTIYLPMVRRD
jgi:parallel beta-helix repeat protein